MANSIPSNLSALAAARPEIFRFWKDLNPTECEQFSSLLQSIDFSFLNDVAALGDSATAAPEVPRADIATAPVTVVLQPQTEQEQAVWQQAASAGENLLNQGGVAVITVAGGQGSRLGFDHPKGMFPIGPVSGCTLFQWFAEQIAARRKRHGAAIPWLIMTSAATHEETVAFFESQSFFGLARDTVHFFQQGSLPAVDASSGHVLLASKSSLALSPDGHGGLVKALKESGLLDQMSAAGVKHYFYHQVDNPTAIVCDPALLGFHVEKNSQLTTNVVRKLDPTELMGALAEVDGKMQIIEYSELTEEQARRTDQQGDYIFWAGNTAIHVFSAEFLHQLTDDGCRLELHVAHKKVPHLDEAGQRVEPAEPNAHKFERFIFDALPLAECTLVVEGDRAREFNPVKNATGSDSPETAKAAIQRIGREWFSQCGQDASDAVDVEIRPSVALDAKELAARLESGEVDVSAFVFRK